MQTCTVGAENIFWDFIDKITLYDTIHINSYLYIIYICVCVCVAKNNATAENIPLKIYNKTR